MKAPKSVATKWEKRLKREGLEVVRYQGRPPNGEHILRFFLILDHLMTSYEKMPTLERKIMQLYSEGQQIKQIVKKLRFSDSFIRKVIRRYRYLVQAIDKMQGRDDFQHSLKPQELAGLKGASDENK